MEKLDEFIFEEDRIQVQHKPREKNPAFLKKKWKILIVDDETDVHDVTYMTLKRLMFDGRGTEFLNAYSAAEAKQVLHDHPDVAVILLDVVMENEDAGLSLIHYIRKEIKNAMVRIILRTGHPGQAPEESVTIDYDINDYREKTELTTERLRTAVVTALRSYRDLSIIDENRRDLKQIISSSTQIFRLQSLTKFANKVLEQLTALSCLQPYSHYKRLSSLIAQKKNDTELLVLAATGRYQPLTGSLLLEQNNPELWHTVQTACKQNTFVYYHNRLTLCCPGNWGSENVIYLEGFGHLTEWELDLLEMFRLNVLIALDNIYLNKEIETTQKECLFTLGEIAESRSPETGNHVKRVGEAAKILALKFGLSEEEAELLRLAASMHDLGKLAIPESILNKPGTLTPEEFAIMKTHSEMGYEMLKKSKQSLFQIAALIAREHHENFDGTGYPRGLKGQEIHIYSRIVALADVFDALGNKRSYKSSWSNADIIDYIQEQNGKKFDPQLVSLFFSHLDEFIQVRETLPDNEIQ